MASTLVLLLQLLLVSLASASHHFGGTVTFTYKGTNPDGTHSVEIRNKETFDGCYYHYYYGWSCYSGNCGIVNHTKSGLIDQSFNAPRYNRQWCETETVMRRTVPSDKPFQLREASCCWISARNSIWNWRLLTFVDLGTRSDTGKPNRSPDVAILPFLRVPQNCPRTYKLMAFDPDGDKVRCRNGIIRQVECSSCNLPSAFLLDQDSCTLYYRYANADARIYAMEMVAEDFPQGSITLGYADGSRSHRAPLIVRSKRQAVHTAGAQPWWWWQVTTATAPRIATTSTPTNSWWWWWQGATTTAPRTATGAPTAAPWWWWQGTTATAPRIATTSTPTNSWWWWWQGHTTATPSTTTTAPSTTPWWWWQGTTTTAPRIATTPTNSWWWWWQGQTTTTPSTTTTAPSTTPWWWWQGTTTTAPRIATTPTNSWWWWWQGHTTTTPSTTTTAPSTTPWWWWQGTTTTAPRIATTPTNSWWWWWQGQTTTTPSTTTTAPTTTTTAPTTPQAPTTTIPYTRTTSYLHATTLPLSKLPLHFSFLVDPPAPSCQEGLYLPKLLPPTPENGARIYAEVNKEVEIRVKAQASHATIHDIIMTGPLNISKHRTTHDEFVIRWTPPPDDLGNYFPICFAVEAVTRSAVTPAQTITPMTQHHYRHTTQPSVSAIYQSEMRCVLLEVGKRKVESHVICTETTMTVEVEKSSFSGLHEDHLRLNDPTNTACNLTTHSNSTHIIGVIPLNACGTQIEEDDDNLIFRNEITTFDNVHDLITRKHLFEVQFCCVYPKRGNVTQGFKVHRKNITVWEKGFGTFTYQFEFYPNNQFHTMIDPNSYPVEYELGSRIYMQIEATSSVNNTELFVESCRATPYDNPNYRPTYSIIDNGCKVDQTVQIHSPAHGREFRFSMEAFKFIGLHDQVYISCSVMMCKEGDPNSRCSQGCINSTSSAGRKKRELATQTSRHQVSQGPILLRRSAERTEGSAMSLNLNLVFIAGCLLAAVAMISAVVMYKTRMSRVRYQPLPTYES
ncbi:uncharacterized protein ABDE67_003135 [Symphorus nematophorus]